MNRAPMVRTGLVEAWQIKAFETDVEEWWLIASEEELTTARMQRSDRAD